MGKVMRATDVEEQSQYSVSKTEKGKEKKYCNEL